MTKNKFKKVRTTMNLSQQQFAELLGYEKYITILRKEKGDTPITKQDEIIIGYLIAEPKTKRHESN